MADYPFFFTWGAQNAARPVHITGGEGAFFDTADGARWLDMAALVYQVNAGHGHRGIIDAVRAQAETLCVASPSAVFPAKTRLAEQLLELAPEGYDRVFFTLGGSEATENALKIARMVTGRYKVISRYRSYHGATLGALSMTGDYRRPPLEPALVGAIHALDCACHACPFGKTLDSCEIECASHIGQLLDLEGRGTVAAVVLEPVPGANGVLVPPPDYWPRVREACDRDGALLVADEVLTGFGRTGRWFGFEHFGAVPDMITVAKGLTGGYAPLGAVLVHERVSRHFDDHVLYAGLTNYAHPLGCAAGSAAIDAYRDEGMIDNAAALGPVLADELAAVAAAWPDLVRDVRHIGLLAALQLDTERVDDAAWGRMRDALDARHVLTHPRAVDRTLILSPPLCISEADLRDGVRRIGEAVGTIG